MFQHHHLSVASAAPAILFTSTFLIQQYEKNQADHYLRSAALRVVAHCERLPSIDKKKHDSSSATRIIKQTNIPDVAPSKFRQSLYAYCWFPLPSLPRRLASHDPIWCLTAKQKRQRQSDELKQSAILKKITSYLATPTNGEKQRVNISKLQQEWLKVVYGGDSVSLQDRQLFLEIYGCSGWTENVLHTIVSIAGDAGIVEIGAGNGQWSRAISEQYNKRSSSGKGAITDYVLAYDDNSHLPLNTVVYHANTKPAHEHFGKVHDCSATGIDAVLSRWVCRGRSLLLVYPPPSTTMAYDAVKKFDELGGTILFYVGEGRGGATADDAFFDFLEDPNNNWYLQCVVPVQPFGSKGYEQLFVLQKQIV